MIFPEDGIDENNKRYTSILSNNSENLSNGRLSGSSYRQSRPFSGLSIKPLPPKRKEMEGDQIVLKERSLVDTNKKNFLKLKLKFFNAKDTRQFRRWLYKKLQLELNDATGRSSTAGRIIQDIHIRDLDVGTHAPMIKNIRVSEFKLCDSDQDMFDELVLYLDLDYKGGFQMSVDAMMAFGKFAQLSVKLLQLKGRARITITRQPFAHWSFSFVENPQMNFKIDSQFQGRNLRHLIPLINTAFRKIVQLKHVWPNYKIRFRPFFQNPLFNISPNIEALKHIQLSGSGLEVTILSSSRLNISSLKHEGKKLFCKVFLDKRPFGSFSFGKLKGTTSQSLSDELHVQSLLLTFSKKGINDKIGLSFVMKNCKKIIRFLKHNGKDVCVDKVEPNSNAEKCGFKVGDILVAVNNIPVRNGRQANRLLSGTASDLLVLVERELEIDKFPSLKKSSKSVDDFILLGAQPFEFKAEDLEEVEIEKEEEEEDLGKCLFKSASDSIELVIPLQTNRQSIDYSNTNKTLEIVKQVGEKVGKQVANKVDEQVGNHVGEKEREQIVKQVGDKVANQVGEQLNDQVGKQIVKQAGKLVRKEGSFKLSNIKKKKMLHRRSRSDSSLYENNKSEFVLHKPSIIQNNIKTNVSIEDKFNNNVLDVVDNNVLITNENNIKRTDNVKSKRERLHAKANEMAKHWQAGRTRINELWNRRKTSELAIEANDEIGDDLEENFEKNKGISPSPLYSKESENIFKELNMIKTKHVPITKDPLWGQSLHFILQNESFYLNVLVCSEGKEEDEEEEEKDSCELVGFTSIYVPRIIDDCTLTLSNSHRERFHLKGPKERENIPSLEYEELSKYNGFDSRLCFGDIIIGFRFFPNGLHFICLICSGKIWLKGGSRCENCLIICHTNNKCLDKAKTIECNITNNKLNINYNNNDDEPFEELVAEISESVKEANILGADEHHINSINNPQQQLPSENENKSTGVNTSSNSNSGCRRRRIAEKLQTTMSTLKQVGGGIRKKKLNIPEIINNTKEESSSRTRSTTEPPESPTNTNYSQGESQPFIAISDVLDRQLFLSLDGFPKELNINELRFEPGNAYNPHVICETKSKGKFVFGNLSPSERKLKINEQIDRVQTMIEKVTRERRSLPCKNDENFDIVDNRLQALALVMLLYCSGLEDCMDKEETEINIPKNVNKNEEID
ncbi:hypothetical protein Mgra_00007648 [Meloidogyne graminicola]|uniref:PDZ domain-containing protein n=1 Tax=Meloidogyne graminicola TaxID=189291 RepID=A0A8S9ZI19_9BILA|nr:hypothetical protein Mgra_00007648 [Meloidogyne graminicola]